MGLGTPFHHIAIGFGEIEKKLKKASKAIDSAAGLTANYELWLQFLCDPSKPDRTNFRPDERQGEISQAASALLYSIRE